MVLFSIRKISKDDRALINVLRQETPGEELELTTFVEKVFREELGLDKRGPAVEENNFTGVTERPKDSNRPRSVHTSEFRK